MKKSVFALLGTILISGCATTYDPAEVCSAEWIKPRTAKAVSAIEKDTRGVIKNLLKVAETYMDGKTPGPLQMWSLSNSAKRLENELESGRGIKDLRILAKTCNEPKIIADAVGGFMRDQGLPEQMVRFIEGLEKYRNLMLPDPKV